MNAYMLYPIVLILARKANPGIGNLFFHYSLDLKVT